MEPWLDKERPPPLHKKNNNFESLTDKHIPSDNKDIWRQDSVSMAVWRRMTRVKSTCKKPACLECLVCKRRRTRAWVSVRGVGVHDRGGGGAGMDWDGWLSLKGRMFFLLFFFFSLRTEIWKQHIRWSPLLEDWIFLSIFLLSISLIFPPAEKKRGRHLFVCAVGLSPTPAAHIYSSWQSSMNSYSRVMFLQLFRHRHCVAMSQSSNQAFLCINTQTGFTQHALEATYQHQ